MKEKMAAATVLVLCFMMTGSLASDFNVGGAIMERVCPVDLAILMDVSGSICNDEKVYGCQSYEDMKNFVTAIIQGIKLGPKDARIALMTFGTGVHMEFNLDRYTDKQDIVDHIRNMTYKPWQRTRTDLAIDLMMEEIFGSDLDRGDAPNAAIVLTDGVPSEIRATLEAATEAQKTVNIYTIAVGITSAGSREVLEKLSSYPHEENRNYFMSQNFELLDQLVDNIQYRTCTSREIIIPRNCTVDLALLVDVSGSICDDEWIFDCEAYQDLKRFIKEVIGGLSLGGDFGRVALITFGSDATVEFGLSEFSSVGPALDYIDTMEYYPWQTTRLDLALRKMLDEVFVTNEDRYDVPDVAMVITDGIPTKMEDSLEYAAEAQNRGITIYSLGVGLDTQRSRYVLENLSSEPREENINYFLSHDYMDVKRFVEDLQDGACIGSPGQ